MATSAILKNRKIAIFLPRFDRFRPNLARRRISTLLSRATAKSLKFLKSKMAAAALLSNRKITISRQLLTDFDQIWHDDAFRPS